ncbi:thioesterase family protein [Flavobacteriaceae bacterium S0825]|uniref:acyl-CoA thioesterase n=1 Tax=Gaetbulibacter sp. S0825 TaxID=2720084 RepID=UPI0014321A61|nr:thioesterase family protein [Flavobacteriaceae bacterium S0825]NIX63757.1 thioesterase [Gaetbulibacter sp. S0825]
MYIKAFGIRWNDLDANQHLGNSTYVEYMSHTRMSFLTSHGLSLDVINSFGLGPIVMYEHVYYYKEIGLDDNIKVSLEVSGMSEDGRFIKIEHNFYNDQGKNLANAEMLFSWMDLKTRRFGRIPKELLQKMENFPRTKNFKILTTEDTKNLIKKPIDLPDSVL